MQNQKLLIAHHRKPRLPIVIANPSDRVVRFAARELAKYFKAMSGAGVDIRMVKTFSLAHGGPAILLGSGPWEQEIPSRLDPCRDPMDGFILKTVGRQLLVRGNNRRGTLYAAYALLERLGCRFMEPGIEHVPSQPTLAVSPLNEQEIGSFPLRNIFRTVVVPQKKPDFTFLKPELAVPQIDWMAKRRINHYEFYIDYYRYDLWEKYKHLVLDALLDRGFDLEVTHHSIHYFCPPDENHDFGDYGSSTYERNHPDWFIPSYECGSRGRWQTRVELPAVRKVIIQRYLEYRARNPELKIVGLWPDDVPMNAPSRNLNPADGYLKTFWNRISAELARELPEKHLGTIAYFELIKPPKQVKPHPNQHCWFCPIERDMRYPLRDRRNRYFIPHLKGWVEKSAPHQIAVFEYYGWSHPFIPFHAMVRDDLRIYRDLKVGGLYGWSGFGYNALGLDYCWAMDLLVLSRLLWNPDANTDALKEDWARTVFGRAGGRVLDFYDYMKRVFGREARKGFVPGYEWLNLDVLHGAQRILASARKLASDARATRRIDLLEKQAAWRCTDRTVRKLPKGNVWYGV